MGDWADRSKRLSVLSGRRRKKKSKAGHAYSLQSVGRAGAVFQLSASLFAGSITLAVCFAGDDANEEVVNRFLDFFEAELPS